MISTYKENFAFRISKAAKAAKSKARKAVKAVDSIARDYFAQYVIMDDFGTRRLCWSLAEAYEWLPACGNRAFICETYDYTILAARIQSV